MDSGLVAVDRIERSSGGEFQFTGGELRVTAFVGNLTNQGGNFSPGASTAVTTITGNYTQTSGTLTIELGGTIPGEQYDTLDISGTATLGGTLNVRLFSGFVPSAGQSFEFLTADAGIIGTFATRILPAMPASLSWQLQYGPNSVRLLSEPRTGRRESRRRLQREWCRGRGGLRCMAQGVWSVRRRRGWKWRRPRR